MKSYLKILIIFPLCICIFLTIGCKSKAKESKEALDKEATKQEALAIVDGRPIYAEEVKDEMIARRRDFSTREQKEEFLNEIVNFELIYAEGLRKGYDKDPDVMKRIKYAVVNKVRRDMLDPKLNEIKVDEAEIDGYYNEHRDEFLVPPMVNAAMIQISVPANASEEKREELLKRAEGARQKAMELDPETKHFGSVAAEYSDHQQTRYRGGDIGWLEKGKDIYRIDQEIVEPLFSLSRPGEVSPVIKTQKGYYILKLMEKREESIRPINEVKGRIHHQLVMEKRKQIETEFYNGLKADIPVEIFTDRLDSIKLPDIHKMQKPLRPPALPGIPER